MYTSFFISQRYFSIKSKKNLIYRMEIVSWLSVSLSTMALLIVLCVFNGLEGVIKKLFNAFDPEIKIELKKGKYFTIAPELLYKIEHIPGVDKVVEVLEEKILLAYDTHQVVAKLKGVSDNFIHNSPLAKHVFQGKFLLQEAEKNFALIGAGIQYALSIRLYNTFQNLQVFYPKNAKPNQIEYQKIYTTGWIKPGGIFAIEKHFDENYIIVPLRFVSSLLGNSDKRSSLEIEINPNTCVKDIQKHIKSLFSDEFQVLNRDQQQFMLMRTIHIEKLLVFITFSFIVLVASLNIFFILSMLVLNKRNDIAILYTLGATPKQIKHIFLLNGLLIGGSGAITGIVLAWVLTWLQQKFGFISMGIETSLLEAYPVERHLSDFIYVGIGVFLITLAASYRPAILATRVAIKKHL